MKLSEVFSRANSTFRLYAEKRNGSHPLTLRWAIKEWGRRWWFEFKTYSSQKGKSAESK